MTHDAAFDYLPNLADTVEFADNPEQRTPCLLLLDTSSSMDSEPIAQLNDGLRVFEAELNADLKARRQVEVAV